MADHDEAREGLARSSGAEDIPQFLHDPSPRVVRAVLENRNISEDDVLVIATRKNLPADILELIARNKQWAESYPVRLALARNPKTPLFSALSIVRFLRLFDQVELTRNNFLPLVFRQKIESIIIEKIPALAVGVRKTLARIAPGAILLKLIQNGYPDVVTLCLNNPHLVEAHLYRIINREGTGPGTIRLIADHPNWSSRYHIRYALIRNRHTPLARAALFLSGMKTQDLKELMTDRSVPADVRPCIHRELWERGGPAVETAAADEVVFEIEEQEAADLEDALTLEQTIEELESGTEER